MTGHIARSTVRVAASPVQVWSALTEPSLVAEWMLGSQVSTTWLPGSPITWSGEYEGRRFEDKGEVLEVRPGEKLVMTHFSPLGGAPDSPENYHTLTFSLSEEPDGTLVELEQDNNPTPDAAEHSKQNWDAMLAGLKRVAEG